MNLLDQDLPAQGHLSPSTEPPMALPETMPFPEIIDSSMLSSFKSCEALFNYSYVQHWKPKELSVHLHAGASFAKGLEVARTAFFTGEYRWLNKQLLTDNETGKILGDITTSTSEHRDPYDVESSIAVGLQALLVSYGNFECPEDSAKSASRMAGAFEFYFEHYPLQRGVEEPITMPGGRRGIEFSFAEPCDVRHPVTGNPILIVGRLDAILEAFGGNFMCDEKTTTQLGASWSRQWDLRGQFSGYAWACGKAGIDVQGALIRGISILKTKYDTQQVLTYRPEWQINRWYDESMVWLERAILAWKTGRWLHNLDESCTKYSGCSFREVCLSQDPQPWLDTNFERRVWNPLLREEKKL
jgi:hypothetical protein